MSNNPFGRYAAAAPESADTSSAERRLETSNSQRILSQRNTTSSFDLLALDQAEDGPSPWSASSSGTDFDSLTLPPINTDNNYNELPSFNNPQYFDALPHIQSPNSFLEDRPTATITTHQPHSPTLQTNHEPPPSNQQQRRAPRPVSQYRLASESPDPFEDLGDLDFRDLSLPPGDILPHSAQSTRLSSFVDLTEFSPATMAPASRKRKATLSGTGRVTKVANRGSSKASRPTSASGTKELSELQTIDLVDIEDKKDYEERMAKEKEEMINKQNQAAATKSVKLAEFQCIICMDNPTDLTVTYCGHLFCSECLHQALHAGDKKCCPVCRSNIAARKAGGKPPKNGFFPLEMKFMTAKRKGKQPARN